MVITTDNITITSQQSVKYLGCILDDTLGGAPMALSVLGKVNARTRFLARKSSLLNQECLKTLATCLVQCHFDYAISSWYWNLNKPFQIKLQTAQNKLIRVVLGLHFRSHVGKSQFTQLQWLPIEARASQIRLMAVHRILNMRAPAYSTLTTSLKE